MLLSSKVDMIGMCNGDFFASSVLIKYHLYIKVYLFNELLSAIPSD